MNNDPQNDFDIPAAASTPPPAAPQAPAPAKAPVAPRPNLVAASLHPAPALVPLELPSDFRAALQLVQKLQRDYEQMPNTTRDQQIARWDAQQRLEAAKVHAKQLQQVPVPPIPVMDTVGTRPADLKHVASLREQILAELRK